MRDKEEKFPLNFDATTWSIEEAVPWIFYGDSSTDPSWNQFAKLAVGYVVGEIDDRRLPRDQSDAFSGLQKYLRKLVGVLKRSTAIIPLVWCRIAIQFWLEHGRRQRKFVSAMTRWVKAKNKNGVALVSYTNAKYPNGREVPLEVFLFANKIPESALIHIQWKYPSLSAMTANQPKVKSKTKSPAKISAESQVGSNLLAAVKVAVQNWKNDKRGCKFFLRTPEPDTGKFRFIGSREDMYAAIYRISDDLKRERLMKNGKTKAYEKESIIRAISKVAICRLSWAK